MTVSEVTRRNIIDLLRIEQVQWNGRLSEIDFLSRLFDLEGLHSTDHRFSTVEGDINQHRVMNNDWDDDWIYSDSRFNILRGNEDVFLRFLCEMVHPVVRTDAVEVSKLVRLFNDHLVADGWEIVEKTKISERSVFAARRRLTGPALSLKSAKIVATKMSADYLSQQITRMESAIESDPELAIGTAKELIETCCKTILSERGKSLAGKPDIPELTKATLKELELVPDGIPDAVRGRDVIKRLLSNLGTIGNGLAELRGLYGTGHGKHGKASGLSPRHAKLAVGASTTLATFLFETHMDKKK